MNPITDKIRTGTVGEILVQIRLLEHGVQAAPPIKDSGNDLIAIRGSIFRAVQVKTTTGQIYNNNNLPDFFHILAVVQLESDENKILLDQSRIFLIPLERVKDAGRKIDGLSEFIMTKSLVDQIFT